MKSPWMRRIALAIGALALLLVIVATVLIATFDANRYKALAIDWMKAEHQRTLAIDGPIELSFLPRLAVKVSGLRLSERGRDDDFATVDEAALAVAVLPLLRKHLVVDRVSARGVRVVYLRDAQGRRNVDDLVAPGSAGTSPPAPAGPALHFDISAVQFDNLHLRVRDETAKIAGDVVLQSFTSGRLADRVETPLSLRATVQLTQPQAVKLALDGRMTLALNLDKNAVALSGMELGVSGDAAGAKALSLALEGALAWDGSALRAGPLQIGLKAATFGATTLAPSTLEVQRALFEPGAQRLELDALKLALAGRQGADPFELSLAWPQLAVDARQLNGSALSGRIKITGASALAGDFRTAAPSGNFDALRLPGLELKLAGSAGPRKIEAAVKADLLLDLGHSAAAIERLDLRATLADPGLQPLQLALRGSAGADARAAHWQLDGALNADHFESQGQAAFAGAVPNIKASAHFDSLDLNKLLPPQAGTTAPAPPDTPLALDGLKTFDGQFKFSAGALAVRQYRVSQATAAATLAKGSLNITQLAGRAWGGNFTASGSADANTHRVAFKLDGSGVDVNALLKDVAGKDLLEGSGHVAADLNASGATVGALRASLAGTAAVQLRNGAVKGINLARALRQAKAALSFKQDSLTQASGTEKTDFSEMNVSARIADGVAQSDDLDLKSPFLRIGGAGRFDIGRGRIDYTARATVVASAAGQGSAELDALRGVTVPVLLSGPFDAITWKIQWSEVATDVLKGKVKDKLVETLGTQLGLPRAGAEAASAPARPKDVLKDKLKGLFK